MRLPSIPEPNDSLSLEPEGYLPATERVEGKAGAIMDLGVLVLQAEAPAP